MSLLLGTFLIGIIVGWLVRRPKHGGESLAKRT